MKNIESSLKELRSYSPPKKFSETSRLTNSNLKLLYDKFNQNPEKFWSDLASEEITWIKKFNNIKTGIKPFTQWFGDGTLNVSANCFFSASPISCEPSQLSTAAVALL